MTEAKSHFPDLDDDDLPLDYDLSQLGPGVRGKHAAALRQGYQIIIHHTDGTTTTRQIPPEHPMNDNTYHWRGDRVSGDKISGDKVMGDKVMGDKIGTQINNSQNLAQAAQDIKDLLSQLDRDYDRTTPSGQAMISAKMVAAIEQDPTLRARVVNALKAGGTTALEELVDHPAVKILVATLKGFLEAES